MVRNRVMIVWRWIHNKGRSLAVIQSDVHFAVRYLKPIVIGRMKSQVRAQGLGRHSPEEVIEMGLKDLRAISTFLGIYQPLIPPPCHHNGTDGSFAGTKLFLMGDRPIEVDCAMFGILAQIVWNSPDSPYEPLLLHGIRHFLIAFRLNRITFDDNFHRR